MTAARKCAGQWRGLDVAIKTVIFSSSQGDQQTQVVASEAAIASNLSHKNVVATYNHDILDVAKAVGNELGVYKFYLIQVRPGAPLRRVFYRQAVVCCMRAAPGVCSVAAGV